MARRTLRLLGMAGLLAVAMAAAAAQRTDPTAEQAAPILRSLGLLRDAWSEEIKNLAAAASSLANADDTYAFIAQPNFPYLEEHYAPDKLFAARIDTVLIVDRRGRPLFWRRMNDPHNRGFPDAAALLAQLPKLVVPSETDRPAIAGAVDLTRGPGLIVASAIRGAGGKRESRGWLIVSRPLDAALWQRVIDQAHVVAAALDPRSAHWPAPPAREATAASVPVVRLESNHIRGWLPIDDLSGRPIRLLTVDSPLAPPPVVLVPSDSSAGVAWAWLISAILLSALAAGATIAVGRKPPTVVPESPTRPPDRVPVELRTITPTHLAIEHAPGQGRRSMPMAAITMAAPLEADQSSLANPPPPAVRDTSLSIPSDARTSSPSRKVLSRPAARPSAVPRARSSSRRIEVPATCMFRYQPQVDLRRDRIEGVEVLLCTKDSGKETIATEFITAVHEAGLELELAVCWLREACRERRRWLREVGGAFPVCVPVTRSMLEHRGFIPLLRRTLSEFELAPGLLELEVPETALSATAATQTLKVVRQLGVLVCVDGIGRSALDLRSLIVLPATKVRLHPELARRVPFEARAGTLVDAIVSAARSLGIACCAAGVDTPLQAGALEARGYALAQGVALGPPSEAERMLAQLRVSGIDTTFLPVIEAAEQDREEVRPFASGVSRSDDAIEISARA